VPEDEFERFQTHLLTSKACRAATMSASARKRGESLAMKDMQIPDDKTVNEAFNKISVRSFNYNINSNISLIRY